MRQFLVPKHQTARKTVGITPDNKQEEVQISPQSGPNNQTLRDERESTGIQVSLSISDDNVCVNRWRGV